MRILASREIGIDAGHRVTDHHSKCRNIHGHRYTIQAIIAGTLAEEGSQRGMTVDYGFLKDLMMERIDAPCDHGLILWSQDPLLDELPGLAHGARTVFKDWSLVEGEFLTSWAGGKLLILPYVPTAENLARHWFKRLAERVVELSGDRCILHAVRVWETPNCWAEYVNPSSEARR